MKKLIVALFCCGLGSQVLAGGDVTAVAISDAWVRALPPGQPNTAAYLTVSNSGGTAWTITGATADIADEVQIHTTREVDGYQRMEQLARLDVAPGQAVAFAPGGAHLMLLGLKRMPVPGEHVRLCLQSAEGGEACTTADVRKTAGGEQTHEHHQH